MHRGRVGPWHRDLGARCQLHLQLDPHEILHSWSMMLESELRALNALFTLQTASLEPGGKPPVPPTGAGLCRAVPCRASFPAPPDTAGAAPSGMGAGGRAAFEGKPTLQDSCKGICMIKQGALCFG